MAVCWSGDRREVKFVDRVSQRGFCVVCAASEITSSLDVNMQFVSEVIPFAVGERVECRTMGEFYDGVGEIIDESTELIRGGTPQHPAYLVRLDGREEPLWYTPVCLTRTADERSIFNG